MLSDLCQRLADLPASWRMAMPTSMHRIFFLWHQRHILNCLIDDTIIFNYVNNVDMQHFFFFFLYFNQPDSHFILMFLNTVDALCLPEYIMFLTQSGYLKLKFRED
jgi:hypothetical protein